MNYLNKILPFLLVLILSISFSNFGLSQNRNMEKMAAFPGCEDLEGDEQVNCTNTNLYQFIMDNMVYPKEAIDAHIEGTVIVQYDINDKGVLQNLEILQGVCPSIDAEALRVMKQLPVHSPAKLHGRPVSMKFNVPMMFQLERN